MKPAACAFGCTVYTREDGPPPRGLAAAALPWMDGGPHAGLDTPHDGEQSRAAHTSGAGSACAWINSGSARLSRNGEQSATGPAPAGPVYISTPARHAMGNAQQAPPSPAPPLLRLAAAASPWPQPLPSPPPAAQRKAADAIRQQDGSTSPRRSVRRCQQARSTNQHSKRRLAVHRKGPPPAAKKGPPATERSARHKKEPVANQQSAPDTLRPAENACQQLVSAKSQKSGTAGFLHFASRM